MRTQEYYGDSHRLYPVYFFDRQCGLVSAIFWLSGGILWGPLLHWAGEGSLVANAGGRGSLLVAAVISYPGIGVGTLLSGRIYFDGGFFLGAVGLSALSMRAGTMGVVLRSASGQGIFLLLAVEVAILYAIVTVAWLALRRLSLQGKLPRPELPKLKTAKPEPKLIDCLMATGIQALITGLVLLLLAQSDAKSQVLVAVGLSACAASAATTYWFYPTVDAIWLWIGPLIVALVGASAATSYI